MQPWDNSVDGRKARADATRAFCEYLDKPANAADRRLFTQSPPTPQSSEAAKKKFAEGFFYLEGDPNNTAGIPFIPTATVFRVYNLSPWKTRDDLVTIVLPDLNMVPVGQQFVASEWYRCTYFPY
jgi:hypothetical protein